MSSRRFFLVSVATLGFLVVYREFVKIPTVVLKIDVVQNNVFVAQSSNIQGEEQSKASSSNHRGSGDIPKLESHGAPKNNSIATELRKGNSTPRDEKPSNNATNKSEISQKAPSNTSLETTTSIEWKEDDDLKLSFSEQQLLHRQKGIYVNGTTRKRLQNVILVTAANHAYLDVYRNWECYAKRLGLKWVFVALDETVYQSVRDNSILASGAGLNITEKTKFRDKKFNFLSCSKLFTVLQIAHTGKLDVVFSDPDNVFLQDPFASEVSLGELIESGAFEYVFQVNKRNPHPTCWKRAPYEGNTGFYYVSGTRKRTGVRSLFMETMNQCRNHVDLDDQTIFWSTFRKMRDGSLYEQWKKDYGVPPSRPFRNTSFCQASTNPETFSYCPMDPLQHPTGFAVNKSMMATYHGNFVVGKKKKIRQLKEYGAWSWKDNACQV